VPVRKGSDSECSDDEHDNVPLHGNSFAVNPRAGPSQAVAQPRFSIVRSEGTRFPADWQTKQPAVVLKRCFPKQHPSDPLHDTVASALVKMEKYELALQGDDYQDKETSGTNTEALSYARTAAIVRSIRSFRLSELGERADALRRLEAEPYIGEFRARQIYELATKGTCQALRAFESDDGVPVGSNGYPRVITTATAPEGQRGMGRTMKGARGKLALKKVLGISAVRAAELWEGGFHIAQPIRSIEQLRALSADEGAALRFRDGSRADFSFGLDHYEELQEDIPPEEAAEMRHLVVSIVREQQGCSPGCSCSCSRPPPPPPSRAGGAGAGGGPARHPAGGALSNQSDDLDEDGCLRLCAPAVDDEANDVAGADGGASARDPPPSISAVDCSGCDCCWHVDFVGGSRTVGKAGHDVDLLVYHHSKPSSWGEKQTESVLGSLCDELERRGRLVPKAGGWQMRRLGHRSRELVGGVRKHRRDPNQASHSSRGFENLSQDYHDKVFGVWRTREGRHRRIDIVVNSFPEELPLCRLAWTGSRTFSRLLRLHAQNQSLYLSAHALLVTDTGQPITLRDSASGREVRVPAEGCSAPAEVPYEFLRTEEDVLYLLGNCTDAFTALKDPRNRHA
jgi:DNA polymerase/3'-5' exonuclease PolX